MISETAKWTWAYAKRAIVVDGKVNRRQVGRPSNLASDELTKLLTRTAMKMFLETGFGNTTMNQIAARMRMSKATLYARFPSKAAILEAGVMDLSNRLIPDNLLVADDSPFASRLTNATNSLLEIALMPQTIALERLAMAESYRFPQLARIVHQYGTLPFVAFLENMLDRAVEQGELRPVNTGLLAEHVQDIMLIFVRRAAHGIGSTTCDDTAKKLLSAKLQLLFDDLIGPPSTESVTPRGKVREIS